MRTVQQVEHRKIADVCASVDVTVWNRDGIRVRTLVAKFIKELDVRSGRCVEYCRIVKVKRAARFDQDRAASRVIVGFLLVAVF